MIRFINTHIRYLVLAVACVAAGAGASAVATAGAASSSHVHRARGHHLRALARRTVAGSFVVHTKKGFITVTLARGTVKSVSGQQLTLAEGTPKATYRTVTLTLPAKTRVRNNRAKSTLGALSPDERATVVIAPQRALVVAHTPKAR